MLDFIRLTRPLNLLIMAATMLLMRYGLLEGQLERGLHELLQEPGIDVSRADLILDPRFGPQLSLPLFVLLVLSTVLIAAGGNIINDYFDTRIDRINKPEEVIVGRTVKRRVAMMGHLLFSGLGFLLGAVVAWRTGLWHLIVIPAFAVMALWMYSMSLKRQLITGNGTVAMLTALVPLIVGLYEIPLMQRALMDAPLTVTVPGEFEEVTYSMSLPYTEIWWWVLGFSAFAFMASLVRELQKDMADVKGDEALGCRTIPIAWGMKSARVLTLVYIGALVIALLALRLLVLHDTLSFWYIGVGIIGPLLLSAGFTYNAVERAEHLRAGNLMKVAMVMGVTFAALIRYLP
ncbi:MAG: geranylgeranylglycerol-phosphate geranylgeranyltransferase [Flavobacteriales bacterium]|nr:geranylgeranylglycerol-phosphate geranylgeranyltransferase [Flavobacteriales bacterium]